MANNYSQFSEQLLLSNDPEVLKKQKEWISKALLRRDEWEAPIDAVAGSDQEELFKQYLAACDVHEPGEVEFWPDFGWNFSSDVADGNYVWLYSEDGFNVDNLIAFVQAFLKQHYPDRFFTMQWADYCERLRVGEFGGGALVVTPTMYICKSTHNIVEEALKTFKAGEST